MQKPYELLVRFKPDGTVSGIAARYIETINGRDFELDPVPLASVNDPAFAAFAQSFAAAVTAERDQLSTQLAALQSQHATTQAELAAVKAELDALKQTPEIDLTTIAGAKQYISAERFKKETGGISIDGQAITTERDEIGHWFPRFFNAYQWLQGDARVRAVNPQGIYPYKPKNGDPVILGAMQVVRAYECLAWYINACFAVEDQLYESLKSATIEQVLASMPSAWPQREFTWEPPA